MASEAQAKNERYLPSGMAKDMGHEKTPKKIKLMDPPVANKMKDPYRK